MDLQEFYQEHAAQARHHEDQRERMTNVILAVSGTLTAFVTFAELSLSSLPAALGVVALGVFGYLFAGKHNERQRLHYGVMKHARREMEPVGSEADLRAKTASEVREDAETEHYARFRWPRYEDSSNERQKTANSWIARARLHRFWEALHLIVCALGIALVIAIGIKCKWPDVDRPLRVEIVTPAASTSP